MLGSNAEDDRWVRSRIHAMNAMNVNTMRMIVLGLLVATGCRAKSADTTTPEDAASTPPAGAGAQPDAAAAENAGYDDESPEDDEPY